MPAARLRRWLVLAVTFLYLLPTLLFILPSPASAAERALYNDLQASRCLEDMGSSKGLPGAKTDHDCCVLCAASPSGLRVQEPEVSPIVFRAVIPAPVASTYALGPPRGASQFLSPLSRRGPPA